MNESVEQPTDDQPNEKEDEAAEQPVWRRLIGEWVKTIFLALVLVLAIRGYVVEAYVIKGSSMEPTLHDEERLLITKFPPALASFSRGDIVIFRHPSQVGKRLIKRIIGLPGETVEILGGRVHIDGKELNEPYLDTLDGSYEWAKVVPEGHYFVLGDHRGVSNDSRNPSIGFVPETEIVGKALFLFYPFQRVKLL